MATTKAAAQTFVRAPELSMIAAACTMHSNAKNILTGRDSPLTLARLEGLTLRNTLPARPCINLSLVGANR